MTRPLQIDFKRGRRPSRLGVTLLLVAVAAGGLVLGEYRAAEEALALRQRALDDLARTLRPVPVAPPPSTDPEHMRRVLDRLSLPWDDFFEALEKSAMERTTLLAITPDPARRSVQLRGEASDIATVVRYIGKLEEGGFFSRVDLVEHEIGTQNAELPFRFLAVARWNETNR